MKNTALSGFLVLTATIVSISARANSDVVCVDRDLQDATFAATFQNLGTSDAKVELSVPTDESSVETYSGQCSSDEGAIELAVTCQIMTSTDSGYQVRLFSTGGSSLTASVTPWSMVGDGNTIVIPCDRN